MIVETCVVKREYECFWTWNPETRIYTIYMDFSSGLAAWMRVVEGGLNVVLLLSVFQNEVLI